MSQTIYGYMDERNGRWTDVLEEPGYVEFRPTRTYVRGAYVAVLFVLPLGYFLLVPLIRAAPLLGWGALSIVASIMLGTLRSAFRLPASIVVVDVPDDGVPEVSPQARVIPASELRGIVVRENTGRFSEDSPYTQIYLLLHDCEEAVVVHQTVLSRKGKEAMRQVAARLASRWEIPVEDELVPEKA